MGSRNNGKQKEITVIGPAIIDVLAGPAGPQMFAAGSMAAERMKLSFGGDALNEAVVLSRFGKRVELISKVGSDEAGAQVLHYMQENGVSAERVRAG